MSFDELRVGFSQNGDPVTADQLLALVNGCVRQGWVRAYWQAGCDYPPWGTRQRYRLTSEGRQARFDLLL